MNACDLCHDVQRGRLAKRRTYRLCASCRRYWDYYHSLTAAQQREEQAMCDAYVGSGEGL